MRGEFLRPIRRTKPKFEQGYLQAVYQWQTYVCLLTGMELANASVYDGATALAEAAIMALGATGRRGRCSSRAQSIQTIAGVLRTYCDGCESAVKRGSLHG